MNAAQLFATMAQMTEATTAAAPTVTTEDMNRGRYVLGDKLELTGTTYFPERINDEGEAVPAVYSGWSDNHLFRILGENATAINEIAPAWKQGDATDHSRGGQVVVIGTIPGTSCRWRNPTADYLGSYSVTATHMNGEIEIEAPRTITFKLKSKTTKK